MLNYKNAILIILVILGIIFLTDLYLHISVLGWMFLIFLFSLPFAWGSYSVQSGFYLKTFSSGNPALREVALTFDDGPHPEVTEKLLDLLEKYNVKGCFFLIGKNIPGNERIVKKIVEKRHLVGNHSFEHSGFLPFYTAQNLQEDFNKTSKLIESITGISTPLFRPPFGVTSPPYIKAVKNLKLIPVGWSIRSYDTVIENETRIVEKVVRQLRGGDIILLHDTDIKIINVVEKLLRNFQETGIKVVPLTEMLQQENKKSEK